MDSETVIKTERLVIRPCEQTAADMISDSADDDRAGKYLASLSREQISIVFKNKSQVEALLKRLTVIRASHDTLLYGAWTVGAEQHMIGYIALVNYSTAMPELQIEVAPNFQNKGYGYEFLKAVLCAFFEKHCCEAIRYTVLPSNDASIALVRKVGACLQEPENDAEKILLRTYLITEQSMAAGGKIEFRM
jgi:RimJ/RimL family protein N-acetyltransferase